MEFQTIIYNLENQVATISFNRPESLNALNETLMLELSSLLDEIAKNEDIKVLILTGAGDKSFVAGADINVLATLNTLQAKEFSKIGHIIIDKLQKLSIPVIAAVNGFALGGGTEIALACDFIYASENAMFGLPEITLGVIPGFGGTQRLPRLVGPAIAKEMIFTGKMISAAEAKEIGLVNKVLPANALMEEVKKVAKSLSFKGQVSLRAAKQAINNGLNSTLEIGCSIEIDAFAMTFASEDSKEGLKAFLEKRKPTFKGGLKG
ncbi:MAG: enoyl-CoA hydratase/isomerase family protein [Desulfobacterales bacterium]|nr:enoyl-CoA hydratase/isomerase family protein [Desulfobacterales bacterium]